jgi:hypothetical protein
VFFQPAQRSRRLSPFWQLLDDAGRSSHHCRGDDERVIGQVAQREQLQLAASLLHRSFDHEPPDVGIFATAGAEKRGAACQFRQIAHRQPQAHANYGLSIGRSQTGRIDSAQLIQCVCGSC